MRDPLAARAIAFLVIFAAAAFFGLCRWLTPPPAGFGAHQQLGLAPCPMPILTGLPCPTCGMTTAFAQMADGHLLAALHAQPAACVIAAIILSATLLCVDTLRTGRLWTINWYRVTPAQVAFTAAGTLLCGWLYKLAATLAAG